MKLYELAEEYVNVMEMLYDMEADPQVLADTLESISAPIESKAENYGKMIRTMEADCEVITKERQRLERREKSLQAQITNLKYMLESNMRYMQMNVIKTPLFTFRIQKNGGKQPLTLADDLTQIPMKYLIQQPPLPDKEAIRKLLEEKQVDWAWLEPRGESLRIR